MAEADDEDPPVVPLDALEGALAGGEFFVYAPLGSRATVRRAIQAAAGVVGVRALIGPASGNYPHRYGGDYFHVLPYDSVRPLRVSC